MSTPQPEPTLSDIIEDLGVITQKLEVMNQDMKTTKDELGQLGKRQQWQDVAIEQTQRWENRTWDVIKWVGGISAGLSISAAIAILGLAIRAAVKGM